MKNDFLKGMEPSEISLRVSHTSDEQIIQCLDDIAVSAIKQDELPCFEETEEGYEVFTSGKPNFVFPDLSSFEESVYDNSKELHKNINRENRRCNAQEKRQSIVYLRNVLENIHESVKEKVHSNLIMLQKREGRRNNRLANRRQITAYRIDPEEFSAAADNEIGISNDIELKSEPFDSNHSYINKGKFEGNSLKTALKQYKKDILE